ncbi:hypothetical protein AB834_01280 [PVC group bacterium (ex Bugula neritina AB1)]|nr:hypothetical protein AB834_01280 [PVC group bacterium (ex Bugula neritina AB1)]
MTKSNIFKAFDKSIFLFKPCIVASFVVQLFFLTGCLRENFNKKDKNDLEILNILIKKKYQRENVLRRERNQPELSIPRHKQTSKSSFWY